VLKIHQIFIIKFLLLFVGALLVSSLISYISLKSIIINHTKEDLENSIVFIELDLKNVDNLDSYVSKIHKRTGLRVTLIDNNGVVIAETNADKNSMENHSNRYEIMHANNEKFAYITRYSKTIGADFLYIATKVMYKDKHIYIRLSKSLSKVMSDFYSLWSKLAVTFVFIILLAFYISKIMSKKIVYDIEQITSYLDEISNKNYNAIIKTRHFYEFLQISLLLKNLVKKLSSREKQKRKYTAKLRLMNKQRNDILSAISHEFKNPIASIMGYAQTLQEEPDINPKIRDKFLEKISSNGEKISIMLDRLSLAVKLENNDLELNETTFDLKPLCEEVAANLLSKHKNRHISVTAQACMIYADKTMIELALINLVDNALKYSESEVELILNENTVFVKDKGIGIKEEHLEHVSGKFYRVQKNSWDNSMGLGLSLVNYILKLHGASLDIQSTFGVGSTFSFSIKSMLKK
jgi:two-component system, OmpR family, phosphate regulon sensor histidine kinase PhoR